jgi:hypothetical protein
MRSNRQSGQGCRSFGLGSQRSAIRIIFRHEPVPLASPPQAAQPVGEHVVSSAGGTVTITSSVAIVNDTIWSTLVGTWRPGRLELYVDGFSRASSTAAGSNTSALFDIYRWGWGFSTSQDFNGDIALIACFASSRTSAMARRWHADPLGFLRPWNELPALMGSAPPATPPSTGTGVITFLMG